MADRRPGGIPLAAREDYEAHKEAGKRMRAYMNRIVNLTEDYIGQAPYVIALFDRDAYLLKAAGNARLLREFAEDGIRRGSIWSEAAIGKTAVSEGLFARKTVCSMGDGQGPEALRGYAVCFSPVMVSGSDGSGTELHGGLALVMKKERFCREYLLTLTSLANNINVLWAQSRQQYHMFEMDSLAYYALLTLDVNVRRNNKALIFYYSRNLFEVLGIPERDIYLSPVEKLIAPYPDNREFWAIIDQARSVRDRKIKLKADGREISCTISVEPNVQPESGIHGIHVYFTTPKKMAGTIAKRVASNARVTFEDIVGESEGMVLAKKKARLFANTSSNVMLLGESGTGKDVFAQAIHNASDRADKPFVAINCGAIPRDLIASELFGYGRGAFTGAKNQGHIGKFELADGGTLFLDEIGEMPMDLQATLLRAVEQKQFMRVGSNDLVDVDVKIIAATNVDIFAMIEEKRFRADLYYRLGTLQLHVPPLRERGDDILLLAEAFIRRVSGRIGRLDRMTLSQEAKEALLAYPWYGNVRELQNLIDCVVQLYQEPVITKKHIQDNLQWKERRQERPIRAEEAILAPAPQKGARSAAALTREEVQEALTACAGNKSRAAELLGIGRRELYRQLERLGLR